MRGLLFILVPCSLILFLACGCQVAGVIAHAVPTYQHPTYTGLAGQSVGVMVWADRGLRADWPSIQLDLANLVQDDLRRSKADELKGTTWPVQAASIVRFQRDHPEFDGAPITMVAPRLGVSRLIFIEIESFSTRSEESLQMFRGNATATIEVVEVGPKGEAKVAYEQSEVVANYPPKATPEGVLNSNDLVMYRGTIGALATEVANHLTTHETDEDLAQGG